MTKTILIYFILINLFSFMFMWIDKKRAIKSQWRISESTLILFSVLGGSIGSLIGMYTFRHKTKRIKFKLGIPIILIIQLILLISLTS